jgi:EmrB/QacA subfamily drug resistance transporter
MSEASVPASMGPAQPDPRRWLILVVIAVAQLMVVLDATVMNIALPSAQKALHFSNVDRQWVVTAYSLSFGSLLLFSGRLADLVGRRLMFIIGLAGFAAASAVGGASINFSMLVTARACQGIFGAMLAPAALSLLVTTFTDPKERGKAFGIYGSVAAGGGAVGLLLGGALTSYLSWRWCLYINLFFAGAAIIGALMFLSARSGPRQAQLDVPGVLAVSSGMFCLVYGFSNAATHGWTTPSTYIFFIIAAALLSVFAVWMSRATSPLLPPRVVLDRNRGAAYLGILITAAGMFGIFLFLTYYLQNSLHYSPVVTGLAFLPMIACVALSSNTSNIVLMPRIGPKPIVSAGLTLAAVGMTLLTRIGLHSGYPGTILPAIMITGLGMGLMFSTAFNTGTYGVAPQDAGVASATVNTGQQLGGSIGTSLLNTIFASAVASYAAARLTAHSSPALVKAVTANAAIHGYVTAFWWCAGIFLFGAIVCGSLMRRGPLQAAVHAPAAASAVASTASVTTPELGLTGPPARAALPILVRASRFGQGGLGETREGDGEAGHARAACHQDDAVVGGDHGIHDRQAKSCR